jgi:hypothetical protein
MARRHTPEFNREMRKFYTAKKDASFEQAKKQAAKLGYDALSRGAHERYRKEAGAKTQHSKARKGPAGKRQAPDRCWMDLKTGKFCTDFGSGKPGTEVAIYDRVAKGTISLAYPRQKKGSRKQR